MQVSLPKVISIGVIVLSLFLIMTGFLIGSNLFPGFTSVSSPVSRIEVSSGDILFSRDRSGNGRAIFKMDAKGSSVVQLTFNAVRGDNMVSVSPDKKKLLFATYRFRGWKLGTVEVSEMKIERFSRQRGYETSADWSHNGDWVAASMIDGPGQGFTNIYLFISQGELIRKLTDAEYHHVKPQFSPDDSRIIFEQYDYNSLGSSVANILQYNIETSAITDLTKNEDRLVFAPSYSYDGSKIAFTIVDEQREVSIGVMNADGTSSHIIKENIGEYTGGEEQFFLRTSWNKEGTEIVFSAYDGSDYELYRLNISTRMVDQLTDNNVDDVQPFWVK